MERILREQSVLRDHSVRGSTAEVYALQDTQQRSTEEENYGRARAHSTTSPSPQSQQAALFNAPSHSRPAKASSSGPLAFYTAVSLYRSHLPDSVPNGDAEGAAHDGSPASTQRTSSPVEREDAARTPPPRPRRRSVPSPTAYDVRTEDLPQTSLVHVARGTRYPTPPWWRRQKELGEGDASEGSFRSKRKESDFTGKPVDVVGMRNTPPQPPPPSRSHTRSAAAVSRSRTNSPSPSQPPSATHSPITHVDPHAYRVPRSAASHDHGNTEAGTDLHRRGILHRSTSPQAERSVMALANSTRHRTASAYDFNRGASTSSSSSVTTMNRAATTTAASTVRAATSGASQQRLHIFEESAAHPSGFPVPRRGPGAAAPRTLYNGLAVLPATVADHHAIRRATTAAQPSSLYGTGNHPSRYNIQKYREGIAAEIGVDPARLREGVLQQRYTRVRSGWTESAGAIHRSGEDDGVGCMQLRHTTTRLRLGYAGGGAPRAAELQDPVSGQSRKPNEVSADYLRKVIQGERRATTQKQLEARRRGSSGDRSDVVALGNSSVCSAASCDGHVRVDVTGARGNGRCSLASVRRLRATARPWALHATHAPTGVPLPASDRRLYWAEHAPLHHATVRGLNALLHGVGEAEEDDVSFAADVYDTASISTSGEGEANGGRLCADRWGDVSRADVTQALPRSDASTAPSATTIASRGPASHFSKPFLEHEKGRSQQNVEDAARVQLQDALRQRRGAESTLTTSSILPAAYRYSLSPVRGAQETSVRADVAEYENDVHSGGATRHSVDRDGEKRGGVFDASSSMGNRTTGLVDSYVLHSGSAYASEEDNDRSTWPLDRANDRRLYESRHTGGHRGRGVQADAKAARPVPGAHDQEGSREGARAPPAASRLSSNLPRDATARDSARRQHATFLFPPMLTPLLQEVDECLRFHGLPVMREVWRWGVADQVDLLRSAGFSEAESQTIVWELERMIRATSTTCAVAL